MVFAGYYNTWDKYGVKLTSSVEITNEILNKVDLQNEICDLIWIANAANQSNKSVDNLSATVMNLIRNLSPSLLKHRSFKKYSGAGEVVKRADRHFKYDPKQRFDSFKERQAMIENVLKGYMSKNIIDKSNLKFDAVPLPQGEIPTREEVKKILSRIVPKGKEIDEEDLEHAIELTFELEKRTLKSDWWEITKTNMVEWSKKG